MKAEIIKSGKGMALQITVPIDGEGNLSKSGKNLVIASSHGNAPTEAKFKDKTVIVGLNAYVRA